jgi:hypothetical protein
MKTLGLVFMLGFALSAHAVDLNQFIFAGSSNIFSATVDGVQLPGGALASYDEATQTLQIIGSALPAGAFEQRLVLTDAGLEFRYEMAVSSYEGYEDTYSPGFIILQDPVSAGQVYSASGAYSGKSWWYSSEFPYSDATSAGTVSVTSESVTVPAGTYSTLCVHYSGEFSQSNDSGTTSAKLWLVEGVGLVQYEYSSGDGTVILLKMVSASGMPSPDSDHDGIPDVWEMLFFPDLSSVSATNISLNGLNTLLECYIAGLDPTDAESIFELIGKLTGNRTVLEWSAIADRNYIIESCDSLAGDWQVVTNITGLSGLITFTNAMATPAGFYRVRVELQE